MNLISVVQLEVVDYAIGLQLQQRLVNLRKDGLIGDVVLLLEHTPVITLGRNAKAKNILASSEQLSQRGVEVFESDRGGDVTFHGPGQLVAYPIFDLRGFPVDGKRKTLGAVEYVRRLEEILIRTCADFGIAAKAKELGKQLPLQEIAHSVSRNFGTVFNSQILWLETLDALMRPTQGVPMKVPAELRNLHKEEETFWA